MKNPKQNMVKLADTFEGKLSLDQLWERLAKVTDHIVNDNQICEGDYPLTIRHIQVSTINALIKEIERHHQRA